MKTLLIDDDPFALEVLALQLRHLGCVALTSCERACDALDLLETRFEAIGLVFCDLQTPSIDATKAMAGQLGMKAVAEGVEDRADWDCLRAMGCDVAQGYFIARPMPGADLLAWRAGWELRRAGLTAIPA